MPAVTVDKVNKDGVNFGNVRVVIATLSSVDNGDTWDSGLGEVYGYSFTAQTNAAVGATISAGTFTFANTGTLVVHAVVFGN